MKNGSKRRGGVWKAEKAIKEKDGRNIDIDITKIRRKKTTIFCVIFYTQVQSDFYFELF